MFSKPNRRNKSSKSFRAHRYSRWDGTQKGFDVNAFDILDSLGDDLLYDGDINKGFRRMFQRGFQTSSGEWVKGLSEMREKIDQRRQEMLEENNLDGIYDDIAKELKEIVEKEKDALSRRRDFISRPDKSDPSQNPSQDSSQDQNQDSNQNPDQDQNQQRREEIAESSYSQKMMELDMMPPDLRGKMSSLNKYEFVSEQAAAQFEELQNRLKQEIIDGYLNQLSEGISPEDMSRVKDMMSALNDMIEASQRGEEPAFDEFMEQFGDMFPENPKNLDELMRTLAQRMAAMEALWNSMSPSQRAQLQSMAEMLMEDMDLQWQMNRLAGNLQEAFPNMGWDESHSFTGENQMDIPGASSAMREMADMDALAETLANITTPSELAEVDMDKVREMVDNDAAASLEQLQEMAKVLEEAGLVKSKEGKLSLTPRAIRRIGQKVLQDMFKQMKLDRPGGHGANREGLGHELDYTTKPYEWGDPFKLNIERTIRNAIQRTGEGVPVSVSPEDFEVERTEHLVRSSTVLMVDLSLSMVMRDNFVSAKKVAIALQSLIEMEFPRDYLGVVGFSASAREIPSADLPEIDVNYFDHGTNMEHGLALSRKLLAREGGTKQIIMVTDGEPTAHMDESGYPVFYYPPVPETIKKTLAEIMRCTKEEIKINVFMLDPNSYLKEFVTRMTKLNGGRAFFTTRDSLGSYVLTDYIHSRY